MCAVCAAEREENVRELEADERAERRAERLAPLGQGEAPNQQRGGQNGDSMEAEAVLAEAIGQRKEVVDGQRRRCDRLGRGEVARAVARDRRDAHLPLFLLAAAGRRRETGLLLVDDLLPLGEQQAAEFVERDAIVDPVAERCRERELRLAAGRLGPLREAWRDPAVALLQLLRRQRRHILLVFAQQRNLLGRLQRQAQAAERVAMALEEELYALGEALADLCAP